MQHYRENPYQHEAEGGFMLREDVPANTVAAQATQIGIKKSLQHSSIMKMETHDGTTVDGDEFEDHESKLVATTESVLDSLYPPREDGVDGDGVPLVQVASRDFPDKMHVIHLQEALENACEAEGARPHGVCPIRERIYTDALDELIRQAAVSCPERGLLLAELRDEVNETNNAYDSLFESSAQFGVRKEIERDLKRTMQSNLDELTVEVAALDHRVHEIKAKYEGLERMFQERRAAEDKKHAEEVAFLKKVNGQLTAEIKRWGNP